MKRALPRQYGCGYLLGRAAGVLRPTVGTVLRRISFFERRSRGGARYTRIPAEVSAGGEWTLRPAPGARILFVASAGGHLAQLVRIASMFDCSSTSIWITFDNEQSSTLLDEKSTIFVPYVRPRGYWGVLKTFVIAALRLNGQKFDLCVTTGAGVALGVLPWARLSRIPCIYIESVSRTNGPSLTGRVVRRLALAETFTQHVGWANSEWKLHSSVLSSFERVERRPRPAKRRHLKVFVTLGTIQPYRFDALIEAVLASGIANERTVWQLGESVRTGLPGKVLTYASSDVFGRLCLEADAVITHAGVGTILTLFDLGVHPVVVPRRVERNEHVDNHQLEIARLVRAAGTAIVRDVAHLKVEDVERAACLATVSRRAKILE